MAKDFSLIVFEFLPTQLMSVLKHEDISHIANCLQSLEATLTDPSHKAGSFVSHIAERDFYKALLHADHVNKIAICVYAGYLEKYHHA